MKVRIENTDTGEIIEIESSKFRIAWHNDAPTQTIAETDDSEEWFYDEWEEDAS